MDDCKEREKEMNCDVDKVKAAEKADSASTDLRVRIIPWKEGFRCSCQGVCVYVDPAQDPFMIEVPGGWASVRTVKKQIACLSAAVAELKRIKDSGAQDA